MAETLLDDAIKASSLGRIELVKTFIAFGMDLNIGSATCSWTPFHFATFNKHLEVVRELLASGADPSTIAADGRTPLYFAIFSRQSEIIKALLAYGEDPLVCKWHLLIPNYTLRLSYCWKWKKLKIKKQES